MNPQNLITKVTQIIPREDGSECRIVVTAMFGSGLNRSIDVFVQRRKNPELNWNLCSDKPHPEWLKMSRKDYISYGRSEVLQTVSIGEILKLKSMIGQPISS